VKLSTKLGGQAGGQLKIWAGHGPHRPPGIATLCQVPVIIFNISAQKN